MHSVFVSSNIPAILPPCCLAPKWLSSVLCIRTTLPIRTRVSEEICWYAVTTGVAESKCQLDCFLHYQEDGRREDAKEKYIYRQDCKGTNPGSIFKASCLCRKDALLQVCVQQWLRKDVLGSMVKTAHFPVWITYWYPRGEKRGNLKARCITWL